MVRGRGGVASKNYFDLSLSPLSIIGTVWRLRGCGLLISPFTSFRKVPFMFLRKLRQRLLGKSATISRPPLEIGPVRVLV